MSNRQTTAPTLSSRLRVPVGRLRDLPIWSKLGLIMIVPIAATVVVGVNGLVSNIGDANNADRARTLSGLSADAAALSQELQGERAKATLLLGTPPGGQAATTALNEFKRQSEQTDNAAKTYRLHRSGLADINDDFRTRLSNIDTELGDLPVLRQQITDPNAQVLGSTVVSRYRSVIEDLLGIRTASAELATNAHLGAEMRAAATISEMKEQASLERVFGLQVISSGTFSPELRNQFAASLTGQQQAETGFRAVSEPWQREYFDQTVAGSDLRAATLFEGVLSPLTSDKLPPTGVPTAEQWDTALFGKANLLRKVEITLDEHNIEDATAERNLLQRNVLVGTGTLLGLLLLAVLFAWIVARSMARSLRELRHGALTVAQYGLPQAVARLRDPSLATQMSPQQVAMQIAEPLPIHSRDEFGQVAEAFNAVHLEAVRTAAEQAALRASVATMFVNLARRSQILVDRLIGHLDRLERGEEDPDRLAELFQLDHLATRMRRNDENLLVLAGADSTRIQREPAPLMDVLRAAQSEVEHYTRIEFGMIDRDIEIAAHSVNDMVHLVAELLDNATAFSPPDSAVVVEARRVGDRAVLLVEDHGIGISPEQLAELNERLANPPMVDVAVSRMMGLVVVARLAARHGVKVELRTARERGTIADVTLPASVLVPRALAGRTTAGMPTAGMPTGPRDGFGPYDPRDPRDPRDQRSQPPAPRSPLGAPLALESGPNGRGGGAFGGGLFNNGDRHSGFSGLNNGGSGQPGYSNGSPPSGDPSGPSRGLPAWSDLTGVNGHGPRPPSGLCRPAAAAAHGRQLVGRQPHQRIRHARRARRPDPAAAPRGPAGRPDAPPLPGRVPGQSGHPGQFGPVGAPDQGLNQGPGQPGQSARRSVRRPVPAASRPPVVLRSDPASRRRGRRPPPRLARSPGKAPGPASVRVPLRRRGPHRTPASLPVRPPTARTTRPRSRRCVWPGSRAADSEPGYDNVESRARFVDETMELPIYEELESLWFRTKKPYHDEPPTPRTPMGQPAPNGTHGGQRGGQMPPAPAAPPVPGGYAPPVEVGYAPAAQPGRPVDPRWAAEAPAPEPAPSWHTAADEGWEAAAALAERPGLQHDRDRAASPGADVAVGSRRH